MNIAQKEEGTFKTIDANISKIYEYAGDKNLYYSEFKSSAGLQAVKDVHKKCTEKNIMRMSPMKKSMVCARKKKIRSLQMAAVHDRNRPRQLERFVVKAIKAGAHI
jgi:hypothetical protein